MTQNKTLFRTLALAVTIFLALTATSRTASATDKTTAGTVGTISVGDNGVSFFLVGGPALCNSVFQSGGSTAWVTLNTNYLTADTVKNYVTLLTAAKLAGKKISVRGLNNTKANEFGCRSDGIDMP